MSARLCHPMKQNLSHARVLATLLAAFAFGVPYSGSAQVITDSATYTPNLAIPDNSTTGIADTHNFSTAITTISKVKLSLQIVGTPSSGDAFNGDFYAYLTNGTGFAILLNRVGRTTSNTFGYSDSGFDVTFNDSASAPDIHDYLLTTDPAGNALTGTWGSDGRNVNPSQSLDTTPRTASLTSFNAQNPNGDWTLFIADLSPTGTGRLASWKLEVSGVVPEPGSAMLLLLGGFAICRRHRARKRGGQI